MMTMMIMVKRLRMVVTVNKEMNRHLDCRVGSQVAVICSLVLSFQIADDDDDDDDDDEEEEESVSR